MTEYYLLTTKNVEAFFNALTNAEPPPKFIQKILEQLEFKSTNDRLYIGVLKGLKFIDDAGIPQDRYYKYIDQTESKKVLAEAIKEAYSDLFSINKKANDFSLAEVKNKLKTIYQGKKSDNVLDLMSKTFRALCDYADWSISTITQKPADDQDKKDSPNTKQEEKDEKEDKHKRIKIPELHYNIQIHLPESRDAAVYDAIFKSLKEHFN
jgi:hypothetical protein